MIIIPFDKKLDWKNPPVITFALILINVMVYFVFQSGDNQKYWETIDYYYDSGLAKIELPLFKEALIEQGEQKFVREWEDELEEPYSPWFFSMQSNKKFMDQLQADQIIKHTHPDYQEWKEKRAEVNQQMVSNVSHEYAYKTAEPTIITTITHMFLHAGLGHLLGNMLFLMAVGFIVELSMQRWMYLLAYLISGIGSVAFYTAFTAPSLIPSLGASGAIAGLMGMYAVLFNVRKIRFFYFIVVYFDYIKLPAIYLLALWLGFEVYQQLAYSAESNVNYLAHIGGLISGGLIAFAMQQLMASKINQTYLDENDEQALLEQSLGKANGYMRDLEYERALPILSKLLEKQPDNREVLYQYHKASKFDKGADAYHLASMKILNLSERDIATDAWVLDTLDDYLSTPKSKITISLLNALFRRFVSKPEATKAIEKILAIMQRQPDKFPLLPENLMAFSNSLSRMGDKKKAAEYRGLSGLEI